MKKVLAGFAIMMALATGAQAQDSVSHKTHNFRHHHKEMYKNLNLTDEQKQEVKKLNTDFRAKMEELKKQDHLSVKEMNEKKSALFNERQTAFKNVLNDEQKTKFDAQQKQFKDRKMQRRGKDAA